MQNEPIEALRQACRSFVDEQAGHNASQRQRMRQLEDDVQALRRELADLRERLEQLEVDR